MRVLIFHGYLLQGTGSNIYNANLAQALARLGHEVHLLCQDRRPPDWATAVGRWGHGGLEVELLGESAGAGSVTIYNPEIGDVLPVYVEDRYEDFEAKTFATLSDAELDHYLEVNVAAVSEVAERAGGVDAALANHLVMGPLILARAGLAFAAKVHGSALEYTVKPNPRFLPHALEGAAAASAVLVGSRHTAESLWAALDDSGLEAKTRLGPPGVDTSGFAPRQHGEALGAVRSLASELDRGSPAAMGRDPAGAAVALREWAEGPGPRVVMVGKLIVSKGVDLLLAAWPLVRAAHPDARLLVVGFGAYEDGLKALFDAIGRADIASAREVAGRGWALEGGEERPLPILSAFLADPPAGYAEAGRAASGSVSWAGRLEHVEVARLLPAADALVMPSTFPESFGMVAVEAAACGALPVSAGHSGMAEVSARLADALPAELRPLLSFPIAEGAVEELAWRLRDWLELAPERRRELGRALAARVDELWSWESVARGVIDASRGHLDGLPVP